VETLQDLELLPPEVAAVANIKLQKVLMADLAAAVALLTKQRFYVADFRLEIV
jgi:hypothetical protein